MNETSNQVIRAAERVRRQWAEIYAHGGVERGWWFATERGVRAQGEILERLRQAGVFRPGLADAWAQDPDDKRGDSPSTPGDDRG
jgi:hypothetical protein